MPNEGNTTGGKKMLPGEVKISGEKTILPSGREVHSELLTNPGWKQVFNQERGYYSVPSIIPNTREIFRPSGPRGYWENPYRIARYHNFIKSAPPDWKKPEWLDTNSIEAAYKYLEDRNQTSDWTQWKYLPDEDPGSQWLRGLAMPPQEVLFPAEAEQVKQQQKIGTWDDLYPFQQAATTALVPQPVTQEDPTGRPTWSKDIANVTRSGLSGLAGYGLGSGAAGLAGLIGIGGVAGAAIGALPVALAAAFFFGTLYTNRTGEEIPGVSKVIKAFDVVNYLSQGVEQIAGVGDQLKDNDVNKIIEEFGPAWKAAYANYETNEGNILLDAWTRAAIAVGAEGATPEMLPDEGEVYRWDLGIPEPVKLPEGYQSGVDALNDLREEIIANPDVDPNVFVQDYISQFGMQGYLNDFVLQSIADPLNFVPTIGQVAGRTIGRVKGDTAMMAAFPKVKPHNVIVDALPMPLNMLAPLVTGGKIQGSAGLLDGLRKYKTFIETGLFPGYKNTPDNFTPPADYTQAIKTLGDLTPEGLPKMFMPDTSKTGLKGAINWLKNLTPRSKAEISYANLMDHLAVLMNMAGDDIDLSVKILKTAAAVDPNMTADAFGKLVNPEGFTTGAELEPQNFITPIGAALAVGMKDIDASKVIDELFTSKWVAPTDRRVLLYKMAEMLEIKPGELLERINNGIDISGAVKAKADELGIKEFENITGDQIKESMGVFMGKDALPFVPDVFKAELINTVGTKLAEFMAARFGLKADPKFTRFMHILKDIQSLMVLGFNPAYAVNNFVNNIITRTADGIFGFMTHKQIVDTMSRLEIDPTRSDMGFKDWSLAKSDFGITGDGKITRVSDVVKAENDLIAAAQKKARDVRQSVGIFSRLSNIIERNESRQAYVSALTQLHNGLWKREVGIRAIPDNLKMALGDDVVNRLYEIAEKSLNRNEIEANFFKGEGKLAMREVLGRMLTAFEGRNQNLKGDRAMWEDLFVTTGILDELDSRLAKATTKADIDLAFDEVQGMVEGKVRNMLADDLMHRSEIIRNRVQAEGITAAIAEFVDIEIEFMRTWIQHFNELEDLFSRKPSMDTKEFGRQFDMLRKRDDERFTNLFNWENETTKGVLEALGFAKELPAVKAILDGHQKIADNWRDFYKYRDERYKVVVFEKYASEDAYMFAKSEADKAVQEMAEAAYSLEQTEYAKMNEAYISLSKNPELARVWREEITAIRQAMIKDMTAFRKNLADNPPKNIIERNAKWAEFIKENYGPRIVALKSAESLIQKINLERQDILNTDPEKLWSLGYKDAAAERLNIELKRVNDEGVNVAKPEDLFTDPQIMNQVYDHWANRWLAKNSIFELFMDTGKWGESEVWNMMSVLDFRAEQWAIQNGRQPHEWFNETFDKIKYVDTPEDIMKALTEVYLTGDLMMGDVRNLASKYGIATADASGKPMDKRLLNTLNKYSGQKYELLDDVPYDVALMALEKHRIEKGEPPVQNVNVKGLVSFEKDGAAFIRAFEAADTSTLVHEIGHVFRRQLAGDDLEAIAKWGGLGDADEMVRLQQQFDDGTINKADRQRYTDAEEKFAAGFEEYLMSDHKNLPKKMQAVFLKFAQWLMSIYRSITKNNEVDIEAVIKVGDKDIRIKDVMDRLFIDLEGKNVLGTTPEPNIPQGKGMADVADIYLYGMLDAARDTYKRSVDSYKPFSIDGIAEQYRPEVLRWINQLKNDQAGVKITSMKYAEAKKDQALLNYSRRTGLDEVLSVPFPYIFWYTKNVMNWTMRMFEQPKYFATYARFREMQERMEREGIPARLRGKIRIPAPYLPDWMGGGLWQDPMRQLFPFSQFSDPIERMANLENSAKYKTFDVLGRMVKEGQISQQEADHAKETREGEVWNSAYAIATNELGTFDPISLANTMATPAMYISIPWLLAQRQPERISPTPMLKTTQAVETLLNDTPLSAIGKTIGAIGKPEQYLREKIMTPATAMFGQWGDYYVNRQLANMVADGEVDARTAKLAMIEKDGPAYDDAVNRVREEVALRVPGSAAVFAAKNGASLPQFGAAVFHSIFPSGLLPKGELQYDELLDDYSYAWDMYKRGYKDSLTDFFNDHPEYEARIAIKEDDPDEQLRQFLISELWDRYMSLNSPDKEVIRDQLGPTFQEYFLDKNTRSYDAISTDKLGYWSYAIGGMVPKVEDMQPIIEGGYPQAEIWSPELSAGYQAYMDERDSLFPNWYAIQNRYYNNTPKSQRRAYLSKHPELKEYWSWNRNYKAQHPELQPIISYKEARNQTENIPGIEAMQNMPEELTLQLTNYAITGSNMGPGAWEALNYVWDRAGQPYGSLKDWIDYVIVPTVK